MKELIEKQKEYIKFLSRIIDDNAVFLEIHHCGASQEDINEGKGLRDEISVLEAQLEGKEWFEKIYIKSEKDLPKKEGLYFVNFKGGWMDTEYYRKTGGIVDWMDEFAWYLKPIE